jgi:hypothetical protein
MELNVPQFHFTGMFKHSIAGLASLYIGNGLALSIVENFKIASQVGHYHQLQPKMLD